MTAGSEPPTNLLNRLRRRHVVAVLGVLVVAAVVIALTVNRSDDEPRNPGAADASASHSQSVTPQTATATAQSQPTSPLPLPPVPGAAPTLEPVPLDETADFGDQVTASLAAIEAIDGQGQGIGEISGPAIRVTIRLTNGATTTQSLEAVTVNLTFGADATPAVPLSDPSQSPFTGSLAQGQSAQGIYVFAVPLDSRDQIAVTVSHSPASATVVFSGSFE